MDRHSVFVDCHLTKDVYGARDGNSIHVMSMQAMAMRYANNSYSCMHAWNGMLRSVRLWLFPFYIDTTSFFRR